MTTIHSTARSWDFPTELRRIVAIWPKPEGGEPTDFRSRLAPFLASDFNQVDFVNKIVEVAEISQIIEQPARVEIEFFDVDDCLHKAVFTPREGWEWALQSLKFQCPVCFGTGKNDDLRCPMCGGTGWGVS